MHATHTDKKAIRTAPSTPDTTGPVELADASMAFELEAFL
jgi:hypothetical protein